NEPPLGEGNTSQSWEGSMQLLELMEICTKLSNKVTALEDELTRTKAVYNKALITLTKRVKKLEKKLKHKRRRVVIDSSKDEEEVCKQGEAHKTAEHKMESDNTKVVDFSAAIPQKDDDEESLAETLKIKKKEMIQIRLDEEIAQRFYEEEQAQLLMNKEYAQQVQAQWQEDVIAKQVIKESSKKAGGRLKRKTSKAREDKDKRQKKQDYLEKLTLMDYVEVISDFKDVISVIPLAVKSLIINWKSYCKGDAGYYEIHRADGKNMMLFDQTMGSTRNFVPIESEDQIADSKARERSSKEGESLKRPTEEELGQEQQKKQQDEEEIV
nr:hypothetical protein [Tanacetum cinerariifolium]